ncbi:hypothetical protein [Saccharopolyspora gloriosae]|uniref:hypothetical protein n=1 Tax=Saccharopolyspora gloriosae TaxID=455344 RepID=UPI001FB859D0|nr:hypothetical protein [Saccharopolyspora gloriosae]
MTEQIVFTLAAVVWLGTITSILVEPGLVGGRKLKWCALAFVPFLGGVLWLATARSRAEARSPESSEPESADRDVIERESRAVLSR